MDYREQFLSPDAATSHHHHHYQQNHHQNHHHHRSRSFKTRSRAKEADDIAYDRPRRNSMPSQCHQKLSSSYNDLLGKEDTNHDSLRRVRSFKTTSKGGVVNRGDSYKKRPHKDRNLSCVGLVYDENLDPTANGQTVDSMKNEIAIQIKTADGNVSSASSSYTVVVLGPPGVGKTSLTSQFMTSEYIGVTDNSLGKFTTVVFFM